MLRAKQCVLHAATLTMACLGAGCDENKPVSSTTPPASSGAPSSSASEASGKSIRFGKPVVNVGDKYTTTLQMENSAVQTDSELPGVAEESGFGYELVVKAEVLAVNGDVATKWKLTFDEARVLMIRDGKSTGLPNPIQGKSYVVEQKGGEFVATTVDGKPVLDDEKDSIGTPVQAFDSWQLPERPLEPGAEVPELASQAKKESGVDGEISGRAWFLRRQGSFGFFKRVMELELDGDAMTMTCHSTVRISDGRVLVTVCETTPMTAKREDDSETVGVTKITARRQHEGEAPAPLPVPAVSAKAAPKPAGAQGSFDDVCYGEKELTDKQRYHIQEKIDDLDDPCPLWTTPKVTFGKEGISLNGRIVVSKGDLPGADRLAEIKTLRARLESYRERWKSMQPNKPFPGGPLTIQAPEGSATAPVVSAFASSWRAGYVHIRLQAGSVTADVRPIAPGPPGERFPGASLYVEPTGDGKVTAGKLTHGPAINPKKDGASLAAADHWIGSLCGEGVEPPCFGRIVFRPQKVPIEETLQQLNRLLKTGAFVRSKPTEVRFTFRCPPGPARSRQDALADTLAGPWGPREPSRPCF